MENLKGVLVMILSILIVAVLGFWAFRTLEPGNISAAKQKIVELQIKNQDLENEVTDLKNQVAELEQTVQQQPAPVTQEAEKPVVTTPTTYKNQTLINELQKLITDKVNMKLGSKGTRVGTVQKFLNLYNGTHNKVDNDFGTSLKNALIAFQKKVGLPADGQAGASTFQKMIDWLKKQG
jgi:peptidoglycan hydrolase-like protein with peptidoglycan-binding domain